MNNHYVTLTVFGRIESIEKFEALSNYLISTLKLSKKDVISTFYNSLVEGRSPSFYDFAIPIPMKSIKDLETFLKSINIDYQISFTGDDEFPAGCASYRSSDGHYFEVDEIEGQAVIDLYRLTQVLKEEDPVQALKELIANMEFAERGNGLPNFSVSPEVQGYMDIGGPEVALGSS